MVTHCRGCQAGSGVGDRGGGGDGGGGAGDGGEGEGGGGGGGNGGEGHSGICVALPPNMKLRPLFMQQAAPNVICAQYSTVAAAQWLRGCVRAAVVRAALVRAARACVGRHTHQELRCVLIEERDRLTLLFRIQAQWVGRVVPSDSLLRRAELACARRGGRALAGHTPCGRGGAECGKRGLRGWRAPVLTLFAKVTGSVSVTVESVESA